MEHRNPKRNAAAGTVRQSTGKRPSAQGRASTGQGRRLSEAQLRERRRRKQKERRRQELRRIFAMIAVLCMMAAVMLSVALRTMILEEQKEADVQQQIASERALATESAQIQADAELPVETQPYISAGMETLYAQNSELIGWISAGEAVDTPVVLRDNEYYLKHDFYGSSSASGTVFADERNQEWQTDQYLLLYGHNMRMGTMFGKLNEYENLDFLKENALVEFRMLYNDEVRQYVPFAVLSASMEEGNADYFHLRNFELFEQEPRDDMKVAEYYMEIRNRSIVSVPGVELLPYDNVLVLVTCSYELSDARLMVFCREVREGESVDELVSAVQQTAVLK